MSILSNFYTTDIISDPKYKFSSSGNYYSPPKGDYESYVEFIRELPMSQVPEVFGMDDNVDISKELQETRLVGRWSRYRECMNPEEILAKAEE